MSYADRTDLEARWRSLSPEEYAHVSLLLADAADLIDTIAPPSDPLTERDLRVRKAISCEMVKEVLSASQGPALTQQSQTAGPFGFTQQFANPSGNLFLTKSQKSRLGVGVQRVASVAIQLSEPM